MAALNFNENTYYVGFDANQGAELQGQMVLDYIKANAATIDRNGDGVIGYILAIGDIGHNDSIARTRGVRSALGTGVDASGVIDASPAGTNTDGSASVVQDATLDIDGKTYTIRELASQEMKNSAGATWDAATAGNAIGTWSASFGDEIDVVVSNNDGMGMSKQRCSCCNRRRLRRNHFPACRRTGLSDIKSFEKRFGRSRCEYRYRYSRCSRQRA